MVIYELCTDGVALLSCAWHSYTHRGINYLQHKYTINSHSSIHAITQSCRFIEIHSNDLLPSNNLWRHHWLFELCVSKKSTDLMQARVILDEKFITLQCTDSYKNLFLTCLQSCIRRYGDKRYKTQ